MLVQELSFGTKGANAAQSLNRFFLSLGNQQESYQAWDKRTLAEKVLATPIILSATKLLKESISALPFLTFKAGDENKKETTAKYSFLEKPIAGRDFGTLVEALVVNYVATGEMMVQVVRIGKRVVAFDVFPSYQIPDDVNYYKFNGNELVGFYGDASYFGSRVYFPLFNKKASAPPSSELLFVYEYDLFNAYRGKSVYSGAKEVIQQVHNIYAYNKNSFGNGGNPSLIFSVPSVYESEEFDNDGNKISKLARFLTQLRETFSGTKNARTVAVLNEDVQIKEFGFKPQEMDFKNALEQAENTLLKVMNIPLGVIGDISSQSYNTLSVQSRNFWEFAAFPVLTMLENLFTQLLEDGEVFRFDKSKIVALQEDYEKGAEVWATAYREGVITEEEYREKIGFEAKKRGTAKTKSAEIEALDENDGLWKRMDDFAMDYTDSETTRYEAIFEKQAVGIVAQIVNRKSYKEVTNELNLDALIGALEVGLEATAVEVLRGGYAQFKREIQTAGGSVRLPVAGVSEYVGSRLHLARGISDTVREDLRVALAEGIEATEGLSQITERLTAIINNKVRARRIAQTEVTNAFNHSQWLGMKEYGILHKMWLSKRDNKVRTEHRALDSQIRKVEENFSNGLMYPSEINCRCYIKAHKVR